jgi:aldehyde dehydrogenase (NAD+)
VDKSAKLDTAVERISLFKMMNVGQTCISPDYVIVHADVAEAFIAKMKARLEK